MCPCRAAKRPLLTEAVTRVSRALVEQRADHDARTSEWSSANRQLLELSPRDALTGVFNRRWLMESWVYGAWHPSVVQDADRVQPRFG